MPIVATVEQIPIPDNLPPRNHGGPRVSTETQAFFAAVQADEAVRFTLTDPGDMKRLKNRLTTAANRINRRAQFHEPDASTLVAWGVKMTKRG